MQRPKPRTKFTSKADEYEHYLDRFCWEASETMSLDLDVPREPLADELKKRIRDGRLVIDLDPETDRLRLITGSNFTPFVN
jgi:hypothetical protein